MAGIEWSRMISGSVSRRAEGTLSSYVKRNRLQSTLRIERA